jgi:uncharacterized protein YjbJ (UPF0337 family)
VKPSPRTGRSGAGPWRVRTCVKRLLWAWNVSVRTDVAYVIPNKKIKDINMNKDRVEGSLEQAKGKVKEVTGKVTGDSKLETEGKADQVAGKVQNTVGGIKDSIKESLDH